MEVLSEIMVGRRANELAQLVKETLGVLNAFAKSKTSKLGIQFAQRTTGSSSMANAGGNATAQSDR